MDRNEVIKELRAMAGRMEEGPLPTLMQEAARQLQNQAHHVELLEKDVERLKGEHLEPLQRILLDQEEAESLRVMLRAAWGYLNRSAALLSMSDKLEWTEEVFKAIVDHAQDGGSYRYLIYSRLGFDTRAYVPLYHAGGMTISNEFVLVEPEEKGAEAMRRMRQEIDGLMQPLTELANTIENLSRDEVKAFIDKMVKP